MNDKTDDLMRAEFEAWISASPYERSLSRWPMDETKHAWPGQYGDIAVQLAWEAWCEAAKGGLEKYNELIMAVARKFNGESRHATALRYIRESESHNHALH